MRFIVKVVTTRKRLTLGIFLLMLNHAPFNTKNSSEINSFVISHWYLKNNANRNVKFHRKIL